MICGHEQEWSEPTTEEQREFLVRLQESIEDGLPIPCNECYEVETKLKPS